MRSLVRSLLRRWPWLWSRLDYEARQAWRHALVLRFQPRVNYTYTQFLRLPHQYEALAGPVIDFLTTGRSSARPLRIIDIGCSTGAEVYSVASVLRRLRPETGFEIIGVDIEEPVLDQARRAEYTREEVYLNRVMPEEFVQATFDRDGDTYRVKEEFRNSVTFQRGDILNDESVASLGRGDIVFAQNLLMNLPWRPSIRAFANILRLLDDRAVLFIDGVEPGLRARVTKRHGLRPLDYAIAEIHEEARLERAFGYPDKHWGLEPFLPDRYPDWKRRYATIFLKGGSEE